MDIHFASLLVILFRLVVPFSIFRWPLGGAVAAMVADASDVMIAQRFGYGYLDMFGANTYHNIDKILDIYYLFFELIVASRWTNIYARRTATVLFVWRAAGAALFEVTRVRWLFLAAPNIFENFYLAWTIILKWFRRFKFTTYKLIIILLLVGIPKIVQEYLMHYVYVDQTWNFLRDTLFWWLY